MNINDEDEYVDIHPFAATVISTFRLSLGDFSMSLAN